jgi:hypothetical protein
MLDSGIFCFKLGKEAVVRFLALNGLLLQAYLDFCITSYVFYHLVTDKAVYRSNVSCLET